MDFDNKRVAKSYGTIHTGDILHATNGREGSQSEVDKKSLLRQKRYGFRDICYYDSNS